MNNRLEIAQGIIIAAIPIGFFLACWNVEDEIIKLATFGAGLGTTIATFHQKK